MVSAASELVWASLIVESRDWRDPSHARNPKFGLESLTCAARANKDPVGNCAMREHRFIPSIRAIFAGSMNKRLIALEALPYHFLILVM